MEIWLQGEIAFMLITIGFFLMLLTLGIGAIFFSAWKGIWRVLGLLAPLSVLGVVLKIAIGVAIDPTSNNLWPFDIAIVSGLAAIYLTLLGLMKFFFTRASRRMKTHRKSYSDDEMIFSKIMSKARGDFHSHRK